MQALVWLAVVGSGLLVGTGVVRAEQSEVVPSDVAVEEENFRLNLQLRTLGGRQFWSDELVFHQWRIQRNSLTDHCRLLDPRDQRQAWGTFEQCRQRLEQLKRDSNLPPLKKKVVVVLHGLRKSRHAMVELAGFLEENSDYDVLSISYASTQAELSEHAAALARVLDHLEGVEEINFVAHSLGNLVVRHYLADLQAEGREDPRIHRLVMLAPPNKGAHLAVRFQGNKIFETIWGACGKQLANHWEAVEQRMVVPSCEFGILAGGRGSQRGMNPLLPGDNDFVVTVEETRLPGARDFRVLPVLHGLIMRDARAQQYTLHFLQHGYFESEAERQSIPAAEPAVAAQQAAGSEETHD